MGKHSELSGAQRREIVLALLRREEPAAQLARRWGIAEATLYRWRDAFIAGGEAALSGNGTGQANPERQMQQLRQELDQRDQVIGELTIANRVLKKVQDGWR